MKWYIPKLKRRKRKEPEWKRVFLWRPTRINDDCIAWFEWKDRQKNPMFGPRLAKKMLFTSTDRYKYREPDDIS